MRDSIMGTGLLIGGAGFVAGYFLEVPNTVYVVGVGLLILLIGIVVPKKQKFA